SLPQAGLHAGGEAAISSLIAHYARQSDGLGQKVVVDMQACIVWTLMNEQAMPIFHGDIQRRSGMFVGSGDTRRQMVFKCKDGHVSTVILGGALGGQSTKALIDWMDEKGLAMDWMKTKDWVAWLPGIMMNMTARDREEIVELEDRVGRHFASMTKAEAYEGALKRRILIAPVATVADIAVDPQLKAREFFVDVDHRDTLGRTLRFPGAFAKFSETPIDAPTRAPKIGEHNESVYGELLGLGHAELDKLCSTGAI
ncbi:MAG TPA: CoA transferase, partial [Candidatus Binataceae bacterium]|nr:CoA transferase [Candidatus Binataceae bacterium]